MIKQLKLDKVNQHINNKYNNIMMIKNANFRL